MQTIHDKVTVFVTQRELHARAPRPNSTSAPTTALEYVAENSGFDVVTFKVDFSGSSNIKLYHLVGTTHTLQKSAQEMAFDCELGPFERRVLAHVVNRGEKRACVRVHYTVTSVLAPSIDAVVEAQERATKRISQQLKRNNHIFDHISKWKAFPSRSEAEVRRAYDEMSRYFRDFEDVFVDVSFPPEVGSLYDAEAPNNLSEGESAIYTLCTWEHMNNFADSSWTFVVPAKMRSKLMPLEPGPSVSFTSGLPSQASFLCALAIIAPYCELWLPRWFPTLKADSPYEKMTAISVALCDRGRTWQHLLLDLFLPSFPLGQGLMTPRNVLGELYPSLLQKAYAKLKGSYAVICGIPTMNIIRELTGSPWVCFYRRRSEEGNDADSSTEQVQLQEALQATIPHGRSRPDETSSLVLVTCGKVDDHHRAFRLTMSSANNSKCVTSVVLHDATGNYLHHQVSGSLTEFDRDQEPSTLCFSLQQLIELEPVLWSLSLGQQYEQRLRQVLRIPEDETVTMTVVISVPTLTTITLSSSYLAHFAAETCDQQVSLDVSIAAVGADLSLTPIENNKNDGVTSSSTRFQGLADSYDGICRKQVVRTICAGEYIVTISKKRPGRSESHPDSTNVRDKPVVLTPASVEANVQLAFDCLDREGRHEVSDRDIISFLQLCEHVTPSQHGKEALGSFLHQHGSLSSPGSEERRLTFDDFREIYFTQAIRDCREATATNLVSGSTISSGSIRSRFQELVWQDLLHLLPSSSGSVQSDQSENACTKIDGRDIVEIMCCFHSDIPLLSVELLPVDESSPHSNNFNM